MSKRILIANAGNARIITEAIWGLKQLKDWIPEEIHIFTTNKRNGEFREAFEPSNPDDNKLTEVCHVLNIPQPHLKLHLVAHVSNDGQKKPIELLKESWETEALNRCYEEELVPLLVDDQTEVVYLARCGLSEMQIIMSYYAAALMSPGKDYWYSVHIRVIDGGKADKQEKKLQENPDFWYPRNIKVGDAKLSGDKIQIDLKPWDYKAMKYTVLDRQLHNPGDIQEIFIDVELKTLNVRTGTVIGKVDMKKTEASVNAFVLLTLANMYELREEPYTTCNNKQELFNAFFKHSKFIKNLGLPYDEDSFEGDLIKLIKGKLVWQVMEHWHKKQVSIEEGKPINFILDFNEVEEALADFFYKHPNDIIRSRKYWWRQVPAFQWKWEKKLIPLASGKVTATKMLKLGVTSYADCNKFLNENLREDNKKTIADYIKSNIFSITKDPNGPIIPDRSKIKRCVTIALPAYDWVEQLHWKPNGFLGVEADKIKFADARYLKQALENLSEDPNTRFDKDKIKNALANLDKYTFVS